MQPFTMGVKRLEIGYFLELSIVRYLHILHSILCMAELLKCEIISLFRKRDGLMDYFFIPINKEYCCQKDEN